MLEKIKRLLGDIEDKDKLLEDIFEATKQRLMNLVNEKEVPKELEYIVVDVSVMRFNRIGSEGLTSHDVEGEKQSFRANDFFAYKDELEAYNNAKNKGGKVVFL